MSRLTNFILGPESPTPPADRSENFALQPVIVDGSLQFYGSPDGHASSLPTLFRSVQMLTDIPGMLPFEAIRGGLHSDQRRLAEPEPVDPQPIVVIKPSPFMTRAEMIRETINALIWRGNAYWWMTGHDQNGRPSIVTPINPDEVSCTWDQEAGGPMLRKQYEWRGQPMVEGFDLLHLHLSPLVGSPTGLGPIDAARLQISYTVEAQGFAGRLFKDSATPAGTLNHPGRLDKPEADALRAQWEAQHAGGRGTAVLSGGITYTPVSMTPEQAQFLATRAFDNQQIATLLGIPQNLVNAGQPQGTASSLTYANLAMVLDELMRLTLAPVYLMRIEDAFTRILPRGQSVRFVTTEFLRTDDATRWAAEKVALEAKILTQNEVRRLEGRPSVPGGDEFPEPPPQLVPGEEAEDQPEAGAEEANQDEESIDA